MDPYKTYQSPDALPAVEAVRLAQLLNIPRPQEMDDLKLANSVAEGLPVSAVDALGKMFMFLGKGAVHSIVSEPTIRRARNRPGQALTREPSERVYLVGRVVDRVAQVFHGDAGKIERFMTRPHPMLDGATPFETAKSSAAGVDLVLKIIGESDAGVAV